jgi:hypothetical protein
MVLPTKTRAALSAAAATVLSGTLVACAADAAPEPPPVRVLVKLANTTLVDASAIRGDAARIAGVRVSYAAAAGSAWHAIVLHCRGAAECDAAVARLRAATGTYLAVEIDGRKSPMAAS